ncbi:hypothetical protein [Herbiconiux sp. UC225_62]|uniref:hypothetical protein n=1 Tax=Herbiconiux sp. UC225_62 TaxID=3350168 RepID=UPI0036D2DDC9
MASVQVSPDDVAARYEGDLLSEFTEAYITQQIADAVDKADARWGAQIESRLSSGALTANLYKRAIANAVLRVARNPDGFTSENDGTYGYGKRAEVASGALNFTQDDIDDLIGAQSSGLPGTFSLGLDRGWG